MKDSTKGRFLRRYTELPFLIDFLETKEITLLNPSAWDDRNDSYYLQQYAEAYDLPSIFSLCLTETDETYHHWRVFSHGASGVCIEFHKSLLLKDVTQITGLRAEPVLYRTLDDLRSRPPEIQELPFLKRYAFGDEMEYRFFMACAKRKTATFRIPVGLSAINRVMLSPWLPREVAKRTKSALRSIRGCSKLKVYRSTLVENEAWKRFARNDV
ncbi:DUF2971 domain-containing protein [Salinisphaera hydrothermalis]|uniref:DUF2971 domain-containing protein n=1 Tax=Salinisphaera hydrothermalis TaxID=563188 RepID=UPI0033405935